MGIPLILHTVPDLIGNKKWIFADKTRFLHSYLIDKPNTELRGSRADVEGKNGWNCTGSCATSSTPCRPTTSFPRQPDHQDVPELRRQDQELRRPLRIPTLFEEAMVAANKKAIGVEPDHDKLKEILRVCMGFQSKNLAASGGSTLNMIRAGTRTSTGGTSSRMTRWTFEKGPKTTPQA